MRMWSVFRKKVERAFHKIQNYFVIMLVRIYEINRSIKIEKNKSQKSDFCNNQFIPSRKTLVVQIPFGGLGDHLFRSHVPRIAKETGQYDRVYISNYSVFRDSDSKILIWEMNPYIDGFCDEEGLTAEHGLKEDACKMNFLDQIMLYYGLDDKMRFHEPEIYYKPRQIDEMKGSIVYDPNYISNAGDIKLSAINDYLKRNKISIDYQMKLRDRSFPVLNFKNSLETPTLMDFCSVIISCKELYCYTTGTATLAAAFHKPATVFFGNGVKRMFHHSRLHNYIQV